MLEFVDSDLYFVQDKNNFINPLLQVGSGSGSVEKITESGAGGPKITGSDRIRILIPVYWAMQSHEKKLGNPQKNSLSTNGQAIKRKERAKMSYI